MMVGHGDPILLINGYGGNTSSWNPGFINTLAENHTVITFDNKGSSIKEMAENAHKLIQNKTDVLGWSMGGFIAQELVLKYADSVDKLILVGTRCGGDEAVYPAKGVLDGWKEKASHSETLREHYKAVEQWNSSCDRLDEIQNPTLILIGTEDEKKPIANSYYLEEQIPDSRLIKLEKGTHSLTEQFPEKTASFVNEFIK